MKTPKRYQNKPIPLMPEDNVPDYDRLEIWCQRAKRKNRIAQYKRKIVKLTDQNEWLSAERKKYLEYYCNALIALAKMREELKRKEQK